MQAIKTLWSTLKRPFINHSNELPSYEEFQQRINLIRSVIEKVRDDKSYGLAEALIEKFAATYYPAFKLAALEEANNLYKALSAQRVFLLSVSYTQQVSHY